MFKKLGTYVPGTSFSSVLAWMGFAVARKWEACRSHPRVLESERTPAFLLLLLLLLLLLVMLASAAGASAAAAAANVLLVGPARCSFFLFQLSRESCTSIIIMDVVRTLREVPGTNTNNI